jgi:hypothetical protein
LGSRSNVVCIELTVKHEKFLFSWHVPPNAHPENQLNTPPGPSPAFYIYFPPFKTPKKIPPHPPFGKKPLFFFKKGPGIFSFFKKIWEGF